METATKTISYWDENAKYSKELTLLTETHMKPSGESDTVEGELIRIANRLVYEYYNNGNCNLIDANWIDEEYVSDYDEEGNEIYDYEEVLDTININPFYEEMLNLIVNTIPSLESKVDKLIGYTIQQATVDNPYTFKQVEQNIYNDIVDGIVEYVLPREALGVLVPFNGY